MDDRDFSLRLLREMQRIRQVELGISLRYHHGRMRCPTHLSIGQEASAVGVAAALTTEDLAVSTHRAHAHFMAKGGDIKAMLAEIYGKVSGCSSGYGGSMHLVDKSVGFIGSTAIVGNSIPIGVGLALQMKIRGHNNVSVIFFGDGSVEEGAFYESINFAAVKKLPVLFVCENNLYSVYSPLLVRQPTGRSITQMVSSIGVPAEQLDGNDVSAVYIKAKNAVEVIKGGGGPQFLELNTYRWLEHCGPNFDNDLGYRSIEEFNEWKAKDPIKLHENRLKVTSEELEIINSEILLEVEEAFEFAELSNYPKAAPTMANVYG